MKTSDREKYQVSLDERHFFGRNGYLKVAGLYSYQRREDPIP